MNNEFLNELKEKIARIINENKKETFKVYTIMKLKKQILLLQIF